LSQLKTSFKAYHDEARSELSGDILDFWITNVVDFESRGFHGSVNAQGVPQPGAGKGVIMATRMLWTFSRAYGALREPRLLEAATLMLGYLRRHFIDPEHGGVYWMLDAQGEPIDASKKFYGQAFAIYALAEYSKVTKDRQALNEAKAIFQLCERHGRDGVHGGYLDALGRNWAAIQDTRLSDKDLNTPKSMNTNLHVLEAYSTLACVEPSVPVMEALESLVKVFLGKILRPDHHFGLFFDLAWNEVSGATSYGHDIEGSWLLAEAAQICGKEPLIKEAHAAALAMATAVMNEGLDPAGGVLNERGADGSLHEGKEWWVQAEAMVGFFHAYELSGNEIFAEKSMQAWEYCKKNFLRPGGEWYSTIKGDGLPDLSRDLAGPWKCPYHTGRACLEIMQRSSGHCG
jgi:mannobiose 2-epimerase